MKLLVLLIVLSVFYFKLLPQLAAYNPISAYLAWCDKCFDKRAWYQNYLGFAMVVLAGALFASLIIGLFDQGGLLTLIKLLLEVFLMTCAIRQLNQISFAEMQPSVTPEATVQAQLQLLSPTVWQNAYTWVAPIFWYAFLGVFGLVLYWAVAVLQQTTRAAWQAHARLTLEVLTWIPSRLLAFAYIVVGRFSQGLKTWNAYMATGVAYNHFVLKCSMLAALTPEDSQARIERDAMVLLLGVYAILIVISWFF